MFETMKAPPPDKILSLAELFRADTRQGKLDLGVGVYKNEAGVTPILPSVAQVEAAHVAALTTKAYVGPGGDPDFVALVRELAFGKDAPVARIAGVQTTGGAGALRTLAGLIAFQAPGTMVHVPDPTWVNHLSVLADAGLPTKAYRYFDAASSTVTVDAMLEDIKAMAAGDVILLHGCCHNPTGADPQPGDWDRIIAAVVEQGVLPFVDLAYQGFGEGLDEDAATLRKLVVAAPELVLAYSCSKNFGIYRDRTGAAFVLSKSEAGSVAARGQLQVRNRVAYSMPPDHGAKIVAGVLGSPELNAQWRAEVGAMRAHVGRNRAALAAALEDIDATRFGALAGQKGMFCCLPISEAQVDRLREEFAIYMVSDGRMNLAGLDVSRAPELALAVARVL
ncbi:amino acid aminotransferase [Mangrovicoccus algicola]|uniref:Aspartate/tyrosine/aromatic aminotransferase n=1 Tax=Mangrovicoccus algicola TaxID=2771008 RepID=A0A8J6YWC5_9RHOB|nr:amino acid aminotransferase [Mangrovicoccus algicola]MBE3637253.1 aspartate/tyrosine/aromatic aminotransferase [Mangrovicoccus algicola]